MQKHKTFDFDLSYPMQKKNHLQNLENKKFAMNAAIGLKLTGEFLF